MSVSWTAVVVVALGLSASSACVAGHRESTTHTATSSASPAPSGETSASTADAALPPAMQGVEECPGPHDKPFTLRRGEDRITGFAHGRGARVAILTHQFRGTPCDLSGLGAALASKGFRIVAWTTDTSPTPRTLRALVAHERSERARTVVLVGASAGGATSLVAAGSITPPVDAVVALSPSGYSMSQGDVMRGASRFPGPMMVVAGEKDTSFADLPAELGAAHDGPELVELVRGTADHGKDFVRRPSDPMVDRVLGFLDASVPGR